MNHGSSVERSSAQGPRDRRAGCVVLLDSWNDFHLCDFCIVCKLSETNQSSDIPRLVGEYPGQYCNLAVAVRHSPGPQLASMSVPGVSHPNVRFRHGCAVVTLVDTGQVHSCRCVLEPSHCRQCVHEIVQKLQCRPIESIGVEVSDLLLRRSIHDRFDLRLH